MANTSSAKKAIRQQKRKRDINLRKLAAFREARKQVLKALEAGETKDLQKKVDNFQKAVDKAAKQNKPLHKNTAARYKAAVMQKVANASK